MIGSESMGPVKIIVVENTGESAEADYLQAHLSPEVTLIVNSSNVGFGCACNQAFERFGGEHILLLNPDAELLPGALASMQRILCSARRVGAVGPYVYWDDSRSFILPPSYPPTLFLLGPALAPWDVGTFIKRMLSAWWRRHAVKVWCSRKPLTVNNLSGGHVLLKREAVLKAGGLFDPGFFLYFEDTDLFVRLRNAGYVLMADPGAFAVHHYDGCGDADDTEAKRALMVESHLRFIKKHCRGWKPGLIKIMGWLKRSTEPDPFLSKPADFSSLFSIKVPVSIQDEWLFEFGPNPDFIPAIGRFGKGPRMSFPKECWEMMAPGRYYGRLGSIKNFGKYLRVIICVKVKEEKEIET